MSGAVGAVHRTARAIEVNRPTFNLDEGGSLGAKRRYENPDAYRCSAGCFGKP